MNDVCNAARPKRNLRLVLAAFMSLCALLASIPSAASAEVQISNFMSARTTVDVGPVFFDYRSASIVRHDTKAQFDTGTYATTEFDVPGDGVVLERFGDVGPIGTSWWDVTWKTRRCYALNNPGGPLTEYQVRLEIDTTGDIAQGWLDPAGADYRALADDDATQLPLWVEGPMNTTNTVVWVQVDAIPTGASEFCLYWNNSLATTVSSEAAVFTYSTPQRLFYPVSYRYNGAGTTGQLHIVSFVNGNTVIVDGNTQILNAGQVGIFTGVTANSVVEATGPIAGRGGGDGMDSLVPMSFAGTDFVFPTNRGTQRWSLQSLGGTATVEIYNGTTLAWTGNVGTASVSPIVDISGGRSGIIKVTNGVPIMVTHTSTQRYDSIVVPPFTGDDLYGVRSRYTIIGVFNGPASVDIYRSDGTSQSLVGLAGGSSTSIYDGADLDGNGTAVRFTNMTNLTGGIQQADRDGLESTAYLPTGLLESQYFLPTRAQYVTFSCLSTITIMVGATPVNCVSPAPGYPGHGWIGDTPAGTQITSVNGDRFFAYYEDRSNNDETNLFGMKVSRKFSPNPPAVTAGLREGIYPVAPASGTWTSAVFDTTAAGTGVFGELEGLLTTPAGTSIRFHLAAGPDAPSAAAAAFIGPDGTAATSYSLDDLIAYQHDFTDRFFRIRATLSTTNHLVTPLLDVVDFGYDLPEAIGNPSIHGVTAPGPKQKDWIVRVYVPVALTASTARVQWLGATGVTGSSDMQLYSDSPSTQIVLSAGVATQTIGTPFAIDPATPHSIGATHRGMSPSTVDVRWASVVGGTGIIIDHDLELVFTL